MIKNEASKKTSPTLVETVLFHKKPGFFDPNFDLETKTREIQHNFVDPGVFARLATVASTTAQHGRSRRDWAGGRIGCLQYAATSLLAGLDRAV